jgi:transposase
MPLMWNLHDRKIYVHTSPVDMRKQYDSLAAIAVSMGHALTDGAVFLFVAKSRTRAKALYFDGTGVCLFAKRLEQGRFPAPWQHLNTALLMLTTNELALFFEGSEWVFRERLSPPPYTFRPRKSSVPILHYQA